MMEQLGQLDDWDRETGQLGIESHGAGLPILCAGEQRRVGVGAKQARMLPTAAERIAMIRGVATLCAALHTMKSGLELAVTVALQVLQMTRRVGFQFPVGQDAPEFLSNGCSVEEPRLPRNLRISQLRSSINRRQNQRNGHSPRGQGSCSREF